MFALPNDIAHKMVIAIVIVKNGHSNYIMQKICINFEQLEFKTKQTKNLKNEKNVRNCTIFSSKPLKTFLTLNLGLPSSFST